MAPKIMQSIRNIMLKTAVIMAIVAMAAAAAEPHELYGSNEPRAVRSPMARYSDAYLFGGYLSYNMRNGYRKFEGVSKYQSVPADNFLMYAVSGGKRFALRDPRFRLQGAVEAGGGRVKEDEYDVQLTDGRFIPATKYSKYTTIGTQTDIHRLFPGYMRTNFLSVGVGLHTTRFSETLESSWDKQTLFTSDNYWTFSPGINIGAGTEYKIGAKWALALSYNMRFLMTIRLTQTDIFPMGAEYREFFYSHMIQAHLLFPKW